MCGYGALSQGPAPPQNSHFVTPMTLQLVQVKLYVSRAQLKSRERLRVRVRARVRARVRERVRARERERVRARVRVRVLRVCVSPRHPYSAPTHHAFFGAVPGDPRRSPGVRSVAPRNLEAEWGGVRQRGTT